MGITGTIEKLIGQLEWERSVPTHCLVETQEAWDAWFGLASGAVKRGPFLWKTAELVLALLVGFVTGALLGLFCTCAGESR